MTSYVALFLVDALASGAWIWGASRWIGSPFPPADLVITAMFCSLLALLPGYGWMLAMVVLWLILRGVRRADLWPDIIVLSGGSALIWLAAYVTVFSLTA